MLVVVAAAIASGGTFLQPENLVNVLHQNTVLIVLAMAQFRPARLASSARCIVFRPAKHGRLTM